MSSVYEQVACITENLQASAAYIEKNGRIDDLREELEESITDLVFILAQIYDETI